MLKIASNFDLKYMVQLQNLMFDLFPMIFFFIA